MEPTQFFFAQLLAGNLDVTGVEQTDHNEHKKIAVREFGAFTAMTQAVAGFAGVGMVVGMARQADEGVQREPRVGGPGTIASQSGTMAGQSPMLKIIDRLQHPHGNHGLINKHNQRDKTVLPHYQNQQNQFYRHPMQHTVAQ